MEKFLCVFAAALLLSSCGNLGEKFGRLKGDSTSVSFQVEGRNPSALLSGIMVYAVRVGNNQSKGAKYLSNEAAPSNWVIPNGNYNFFAFGYVDSDMTGTMHCGLAQNIGLTGGATTVSLVLEDDLVCGSPPFSPTGFGNGNAPLPLKLAACDASTGSFATVAPPSVVCDVSGVQPGVGNIETARISFPEFTRWNPNEEASNKGPGLQSACLSGPYNGGGTTTGLNLPAGPFTMQVEAFMYPACGGFMGAYTFMNGIAAAHDNSSARFINGSNVHVFPSIQMALGTYAPAVSSYLFLRVY